jgi:hypothetical protein
MLGAELTVSHRTSFIKFRLWPCLVHFIGPWSIWLSTCNRLMGRVSLYIVTLNSFVSREISYWLCLIMVLWLKPMVSWRNRGPSMGAHTWLCYSACASITVSSCNPLWDYVNALSWHNLFLLREIHYWCQFGNGVMVSDLWCRSETESLMWMRTQDCATRQMLVSRSLVMIHGGTTQMVILCGPSLEIISMLFVKWSSNIYRLRWIKWAYHFPCVVSFSLTLVVTTRIQVPFTSFV